MQRSVVGLAIVVAVCIGLQGCGQGGTTTTTTTTTAQTPKAPFIPLGAIFYANDSRLTINVSAVTSSGKALEQQRLMLDTGSSTLAFCDASLADKLEDLKSKFWSCAAYGVGGEKTGLWGPLFKGGMSINADVQVSGAAYTVMKHQVDMPCTDGMRGIFGIAFDHQGAAYSGKTPEWPDNQVGSCPQNQRDKTMAVRSPLMQYLVSKGGVQQIGLYWSGKLGEGEGKLYLDGDATSNFHYNEESAAAVGRAKLNTYGKYYYGINVQSVDFGGQTFTDITCDLQGPPCFTDTGNGKLRLPQDAFDAISKAGSGTLSVKLQGVTSQAVELKFDVGILLEKKWVEGSPHAGVILGLPLQAFYYSVMNISDSSIAFVPMKAYRSESSNVLPDIVV